MMAKYRILSSAAIRKAEKLLQSEVILAKKINTSKQNLNNWKLCSLIPLEKAMAIQVVTNGKVSIKELRPDLKNVIEKSEVITKQKMIDVLLKLD